MLNSYKFGKQSGASGAEKPSEQSAAAAKVVLCLDVDGVLNATPGGISFTLLLETIKKIKEIIEKLPDDLPLTFLDMPSTCLGFKKALAVPKRTEFGLKLVMQELAPIAKQLEAQGCPGEAKQLVEIMRELSQHFQFTEEAVSFLRAYLDATTQPIYLVSDNFESVIEMQIEVACLDRSRFKIYGRLRDELFGDEYNSKGSTIRDLIPMPKDACLVFFDDNYTNGADVYRKTKGRERLVIHSAPEDFPPLLAGLATRMADFVEKPKEAKDAVVAELESDTPSKTVEKKNKM